MNIPFVVEGRMYQSSKNQTKTNQMDSNKTEIKRRKEKNKTNVVQTLKCAKRVYASQRIKWLTETKAEDSRNAMNSSRTPYYKRDRNSGIFFSYFFFSFNIFFFFVFGLSRKIKIIYGFFFAITSFTRLHSHSHECRSLHSN